MTALLYFLGVPGGKNKQKQEGLCTLFVSGGEVRDCPAWLDQFFYDQ